jgi:hypothetical protein
MAMSQEQEPSNGQRREPPKEYGYYALVQYGLIVSTNDHDDPSQEIPAIDTRDRGGGASLKGDSPWSISDMRSMDTGSTH